MQILAGQTDGQTNVLGRESAPAPLMPRGRAAIVEVMVDLTHQHAGIQPIHRLYAAQRQPDTKRIGRLGHRGEAQRHMPARVHNADSQ